MKFGGSIIIEKPLEEVTRYFADPAYLGHYQDGFIKKDIIKGAPGKEGTVSHMYYQIGKRELLLEETITKNNLPHSFKAFYHHEHMDNTMECNFKAMGPGTTDYAYQFEYTRINWVLPKLMAIFFPGMYRKQAEKWIQQFKAFVEAQ